MRESNFAFPTHNRACVCISSSLYDRRALDAPAASLPLVNSLTHLSYLTATSARIRESLSSDGGLERLVRILQNCANPTAQPVSLADVKGKGRQLPTQRKARQSPFKAFAEYDLSPSLEDIRRLHHALVGSDAPALSSMLPALAGTAALPPSLLLPPSLKSRHLLYTYTLAFQCIVNIGVRGSEAIRTRVVQAGALEVVVHVLERYLEEVERKRVRNQVEWHKLQARKVRLQEAQAMVEGGREPIDRDEQDQTVVVVDTSGARIPHQDFVTAAPTPVRPRLTRINIVAASSSAGAEALVPPSRVQTPDTILSTDDASLTGDDNGSSSGQETEEITMSTMSSTATAEELVRKAPGPSSSSGSGQEDEGSAVPVTDDNGDVIMSGPSSPVEERSEAEVDVPVPRSVEEAALAHMSPSAHRTPRAAPSPIRAQQAPPAPASPTEAPTSPEAAEGQLYFRDEDILLALQLLAYLSKYPHVREVFHSPSPASCSSSSSCESDCDQDEHEASFTHSHSHSHSTIRPRSINIFSLVELFTHRPPSDDPFTPRLSNEVQYWACTIMRNACRKDEQQGGIRQCANMNCGKWEQYAREFAKCRRCRRAKYCSKACQSASWGNGHKFWCHKQSSDERSTVRGGSRRTGEPDSAAVDSTGIATPTNASPLPPQLPGAGARRRHRRPTGDEDEDDEDEVLPPPPTGGPTARNRSGTISVNPETNTATPRAHHHHHHPLVQPTPLPGFGEGQNEGGMPVTVDEDQIARDMMSMGDQDGVRIQDA
ncbi:MYND-type zinc finger protein MUB1 [Sporobolomyces koalae]|uniref:MYND-type zinc finger protein MUB1 n=1 Tax=Sporobolomyces koalae TaxID=500713 RepID=UPI00316BD7DE